MVIEAGAGAFEALGGDESAPHSQEARTAESGGARNVKATAIVAGGEAVGVDMRVEHEVLFAANETGDVVAREIAFGFGGRAEGRVDLSQIGGSQRRRRGFGVVMKVESSEPMKERGLGELRRSRALIEGRYAVLAKSSLNEPRSDGAAVSLTGAGAGERASERDGELAAIVSRVELVRALEMRRESLKVFSTEETLDGVSAEVGIDLGRGLKLSGSERLHIFFPTTE